MASPQGMSAEERAIKLFNDMWQSSKTYRGTKQEDFVRGLMATAFKEGEAAARADERMTAWKEGWQACRKIDEDAIWKFDDTECSAALIIKYLPPIELPETQPVEPNKKDDEQLTKEK